MEQNAADLAAIKLNSVGPSGNHCTYSVFFKELMDYGLRESFADVVPAGDLVAAAGAYSAETVECKLVAAMTPLLQNVLSGGMSNLVLSNTEEIKWIRAGGDVANNQKCDLVLLLDGLQVPHDPTGSAEVKTYRQDLEPRFSYKFGAPLYQARAFISGIIEYKVDGIDSTAKGELASYLKHLSSVDDPNTYIGLVCSSEKYALTSCLHGRVTDFVLGNFSDPGSFRFLQQRFAWKNKWLELLLALCEKIGVCLCPEASKSAFLGRGGYGVVFRVKSLASEQVFALKAVLYGQNATPSANIKQMLPSEYSLLLALSGTCCVSVVKGGLTDVLDSNGDELGAGYLMEDVGQQIAVANCFGRNSLSTLGEKVFMALQDLHVRGHSHGDARIANIVRLGEEVKWIDMMLSVNGTQTAKRVADMKALLTSLLPTNSAAVTELMQSDVVTTYSKDCSELNMYQVCTAVTSRIQA